MRIYSVSPDLFRNNHNLDDEYDNWLYGCFQSKWNHRKEDFDFEDDVENFKPEEMNDTFNNKEFNPNILKED